MRVIKPGVLVALAAAIFLVPSISQSDPANTFTRPINLSQMAGVTSNSSSVKVYVDRQGQPVVIYTDASKNLVIQRFQAGQWQTMPNMMNNYAAVVAFDEDNLPHLAGYGFEPDSGLYEVLYLYPE